MNSTYRPEAALGQIRTPLRLTLVGLWLEAMGQALWPLVSVGLVGFAAVSFGVLDVLSLDAVWIALLAWVGCALGAVFYAVRRWRRPRMEDAAARLDAGLAGRPLMMLGDAQAIGADDPASAAVWAVQRARMLAQLTNLRPAPPRLRLAGADPFGLRLGALLLAAMALLFGTPARLADMGAGGAPALGPMWEAWATPPAYTGKPALYLADQPDSPLALPIGTRFDLRLYGAAGDVILDETVSMRTDATALSQPQQSFDLARSGLLRFDGPGGRSFDIVAQPDTPPRIDPMGAVARQGDSRFVLGFAASDDYGITRASAQIDLDLQAVERRYGLLAQPDQIAPVMLDVVLPRRGGRSAVEGQLVDDLSSHVFANLPVVITLFAHDAAGQMGQSAPIRAVLPGKRFFDPLASAIAEMRRDILWARSNAPRSVQVLKAVTHAPEGFVRNERAYLRLRAVIAQLDAQKAALSDETRTVLTDELWAIALLIEEGDLASARARLDRAQDRVDEAIRRGASPEEIADLMQELRDALQEYMRQLAQEPREGSDQTAQNPQGQSMSQDQLQQLLDRLQELMENGDTAQAAELMQQLRDFMQNMQIAEGQGGGQGAGQGGGQGGDTGNPSGQAMRQLGDTLRGQQSLSDQAFRDMQNGMGEGKDGGEQDGDALAQRQQELRDGLGQLQNQGALPGANTPEGEAGQQALNDAARAMEQAEQALRDGDLPRALDGQAQALQALRDGMRAFNDALANEQGQDDAPRQLGRATGEDDMRGTDPLGRQPGSALRNGSDENLLQGTDVYRRAEELLEEIRRRSGEAARPEEERGYLKRLLDLF